jgi:hypothetical protein
VFCGACVVTSVHGACVTVHGVVWSYPKTDCLVPHYQRMRAQSLGHYMHIPACKRLGSPTCMFCGACVVTTVHGALIQIPHTNKAQAVTLGAVWPPPVCFVGPAL